MDDIFNSVA